jgi:hypothetical protein
MSEFFRAKGALVVWAGLGLAAAFAMAEAPAAKPAAIFSATTENVNNARESIQIVVRNWSTDAERDGLLAAWNNPNPPPPPPAAAAATTPIAPAP